MGYRKNHHMSDIGLCPVCNREKETDMHILRDCSHVKPLWRDCLADAFWERFFKLGNIQAWLEFGLNFDSIVGPNQSILFWSFMLSDLEVQEQLCL